MLDNYLLEELVTFAQTGTLAQTAAMLNVTQPTVTRGLQKLETELGVILFDRQPNRLRLTATGKLAAKEAAALLQANQQAVNRIRNFETSQRILTVGATLPGPLFVMAHLLPELSNNVKLRPLANLTDSTEAIQAVLTATYGLLFTNHPLVDVQIESQLLGTERLAVNLNQFMFQANQATITFAELKGLSFVVLSDIGPWRAVIQQNIPDAKFFYQAQRDALAEITSYSDFPYFSTNVSQLEKSLADQPSTDSRVCLPIADAAAKMPIYANYLRTNRAQVTPIVDQFRAAWPA
ncbi:LysR family transcriptional regulator [Secundilactobacillus muriivasis]